MEVPEKLDTLENEFKILKSELKETLTNVRDFLLMVRPLPGTGGGGLLFENDEDDQLLNLGDPFAEMENESPESEIPPMDTEGDVPDPEMASADEETLAGVDSLNEMLGDIPEPEMASANEETLNEVESPEGMLSENTSSPEEGGNMKAKEEGTSQMNSQVNLLANLVHWIAFAKKDIGTERIAGFLDVYGVSRRLPDGLKEFILHLADTVEEAPADNNLADSWTRLTLELHGILAGGSPFHSPEAFVDDKNNETQHSNNGNGNLQSITETIASQIEF